MTRRDTTQRESGRAFQHDGRRRAATEFEEAHEVFWKIYEVLKAERLVREAAKSEEKVRHPSPPCAR
jgi:hypothetical protein